MNRSNQDKLESEIISFWNNLTTQQKRDIGFNTLFSIIHKRGSYNLMVVIQEQIQELIPTKTHIFQPYVKAYNALNVESQGEIWEKIVVYLVDKNPQLDKYAQGISTTEKEHNKHKVNVGEGFFKSRLKIWKELIGHILNKNPQGD